MKAAVDRTTAISTHGNLEGIGQELPADVLVVGGGPIGLIQALGFKKLNPKLTVVVLEKYNEFKRKHTLFLKPKNLQQVFESCGLGGDPLLADLLQQVQKNRNIRTSVLQHTLRNAAEALGVEVRIEEVKPETIRERISAFQPKLIIGADGTHSVVNESLFPKNNLIKKQIDYAMQVRLEVEGDVEKSWEQTIQFYQRLAQNGITATEQVGKPDPQTGKTPISLQIIISKEEYDLLNNLPRKPNAKDPIIPFSLTGDNRHIPDSLGKFISSYLIARLEVSGSRVNPDAIHISVNELPASRVKHTVLGYKNRSQGINTFVSLNGDSALGLSYFKGLNAGLEASAQYFKFMRAAIAQGLTNSDMLWKSLCEYQNWFIPYSIKKVQEVEDYSTIKVHSGMELLKGIQSAKYMSEFRPESDRRPEIEAYYRLLAHAAPNQEIRFDPYPHRKYDPNIRLGQFKTIPVEYTIKKMVKLFIDFGKPYKGMYQFLADLRQPFRGIVNLAMGTIKIFYGLFSLDFNRFMDGMFSSVLGIIEIVTTPIVYVLKPSIRGIITYFSTPKHLEEGSGILKLVRLGKDLINAQDQAEEDLSFNTTQRLIGICNDLHRKYTKFSRLGRTTAVDVVEERSKLANITRNIDSTDIMELCRDYLGLFSKSSQIGTNSITETNHALKAPQLL